MRVASVCGTWLGRTPRARRVEDRVGGTSATGRIGEPDWHPQRGYRAVVGPGHAQATQQARCDVVGVPLEVGRQLQHADVRQRRCSAGNERAGEQNAGDDGR